MSLNQIYHDDEFDLVWADPPPNWVMKIGPLMDLWSNPVFQRRYVLWRLMPTFGVRNSFLIGLAISAALNVFLLFVADESTVLLMGFVVTIVIPGSVALLLTTIRLFSHCLVATPLELKRELHSDALGPILTTPLPDSKIFLAECASGLMRGLGAVEEVLAMLVGLVLPFLLIMSPHLWLAFTEAGLSLASWILMLPVLVVMVLLLLILVGFAAGLYAIRLPVAMTVPATLIHVGVMLLGSAWVLFHVARIILRFRGLGAHHLHEVLYSVAGLEIGILVLCIALTAGMGVSAFARARRPGYYEPERANAAGLLMRGRSRW